VLKKTSFIAKRSLEVRGCFYSRYNEKNQLRLFVHVQPSPLSTLVWKNDRIILNRAMRIRWRATQIWMEEIKNMTMLYYTGEMALSRAEWKKND